jgi:hypothetical protein
MPNIFISYRRDDTSGYAGRLYDQISGHFGNEHVFIDVADIEPGADFVQVLEDKVAACDALIALIGKNWLTCKDNENRPRLSDPRDFVSAEIAAALKRNVEVIPVLVGGAKMPQEQELPQQLQFLSRHQALEVSDARFIRDVKDLIEALERPADKPKSSLGKSPGIAAICFGVLAIGSGIWIWQSSRRPREQVNTRGVQGASAQNRAASPLASTSVENSDVSGNWKAVVKKGDATFEIYFTFDVEGDKLFGKVVYPTGEAGILNGTISQGRFSFTTKHVPQSAEEEATITVEGKISGNEIQIVTQDRDGYAKGVAHRVAQVGTPRVLSQ